MVLQLNLLDKLTYVGSDNGSFSFTLDINTTDAIIAGGQGAAQYVQLYGAGSEKLKTVGKSGARYSANYNHNS